MTKKRFWSKVKMGLKDTILKVAARRFAHYGYNKR